MKYDLILSPYRLTYATKKAIAWGVGSGFIKPTSARFSWRDKVEVVQDMPYPAALTVIKKGLNASLTVGEDVEGQIAPYKEIY